MGQVFLGKSFRFACFTDARSKNLKRGWFLAQSLKTLPEKMTIRPRTILPIPTDPPARTFPALSLVHQLHVPTPPHANSPTPKTQPQQQSYGTEVTSPFADFC